MALAARGVLAVRAVLPSTPLAYVLGVQTLPGGYANPTGLLDTTSFGCKMRKLLVC